MISCIKSLAGPRRRHSGSVNIDDDSLPAFGNRDFTVSGPMWKWRD